MVAKRLVGILITALMVLSLVGCAKGASPHDYIPREDYEAEITDYQNRIDRQAQELERMSTTIGELHTEINTMNAEFALANEEFSTHNAFAASMANELALIVYDMEREQWTEAQWDAYEAGEAQTDEIVNWMAGGILQFFGLAEDKEEAKEVIDMFGGIHTDTQRGQDLRTEERLQEWMSKYITQYNGKKSLAQGSSPDDMYDTGYAVGEKAGQATKDWIDNWYEAGEDTESEE